MTFQFDWVSALYDFYGFKKRPVDNVDALESAEQVNDGFDTCPSRRIKALIPGYDKKLHGPVIRESNMDEVRAYCLRFNQWLIQLEQLT